MGRKAAKTSSSPARSRTRLAPDPDPGADSGPSALRACEPQHLAHAPQAHAGNDTAARSRKAAQVERFRALVDARFRERLPVEGFAAEVGLSARQLSRLCRETLGMSSLDVVNARVVHEAERELVYSTLGIKQIAGLLGFSDDAYFGRFFRKQTGSTPTESRQAARLRLAPETEAKSRQNR